MPPERRVPDDPHEWLRRASCNFRYPGIAEPVTQEEYEAAVIIAEGVVRWAEAQIGSRP